MITLTGVELDQLAYIKFVEEYNKLEFLPDFKLKIDTAKNNFKTKFLAECNCKNCVDAVNLIINTTWNENE